ncbi:MAG: acyltransferase [Gemmatimonadaceae bacterium]
MTTPSMTAERTKLPENNLDVLRAIAVLLVLAGHTLESFGKPPRFIMWLSIAGVQAFFVHTSLVLMSSLERDDAPDKPGWVKRFYLRRALRIYPLVWAVIALVLVFKIPRGLIPGSYEAPTLATVLANVVLMQDVAGLPNLQIAMWSLPIEVQMYLVLPVCYLVARNRKSWPTLLLIGVTVAGIFFYGWGRNNPAHRVAGLWRFPVLEYAPSFAMGILAYHLLRKRVSGGKISSHIWIPLIVAAIAASGAYYATNGYMWGVRMAFCAVLGATIPFIRDTAPSMLTRVAHTIAVYSYGVYLLHMSALRLGFSYFKDQPFAFQCAAFVISLVVGCYIGHHLVEKPGIALGKRLLGEHTKAVSLEASAPAP